MDDFNFLIRPLSAGTVAALMMVYIVNCITPSIIAISIRAKPVAAYIRAQQNELDSLMQDIDARTREPDRVAADVVSYRRLDDGLHNY